MKGSLKLKLLVEWAASQSIRWATTPTGRPKLNDDYLKALARRHKEVGVLRECFKTLDVLDDFKLRPDPDGRLRCWPNPYGSISGRNQPSASGFIFGGAAWLRHLIRPKPGMGLAYLDFSAQEIAVVAARSGDRNMIGAYATGDPYIAFAIAAGAAPPGATKDSHRRERAIYKDCMLGVNYGQSAYGLAAAAGISLNHARGVHADYAGLFSRYYVWRQEFINGLVPARQYRTRLGWPWWTGDVERRERNSLKGFGHGIRTAMNWPAQSGGADMLQLAVIAGVEAGIRVIATVHDAVLVEAPLDRLDADIATMKAIMVASGTLLLGIPVRAECESEARYPDRFVPSKEASQATWAMILRELEWLGALPSTDQQKETCLVTTDQ